ncbi:MAG: TrmH family RNA methyltransferase [Bacteroidota bacterium]
MRRLTSPDNAEAKALLGLHDRRGRKEAGMMLLEGPHLLLEALKAAAPLDRVYYLPGWAVTPDGKELLTRAARAGAVLTEVSPRFMGKAATTDTPPPVLASVPLPAAGVDEGAGRVGLVLDGLQDPGNLGAILRIAWGAGVRSVWSTPGTVDYYAPKVLRAAQGAHFHLALREIGRQELMAEIERGGWWLATTEASAAKPFWRAALPLPCLVCIGNEARGIGADLRAAARESIAVPLAQGVDSLNAAVVAGVVLFELVRRADGPSG